MAALEPLVCLAVLRDCLALGIKRSIDKDAEHAQTKLNDRKDTDSGSSRPHVEFEPPVTHRHFVIHTAKEKTAASAKIPYAANINAPCVMWNGADVPPNAFDYESTVARELIVAPVDEGETIWGDDEVFGAQRSEQTNSWVFVPSAQIAARVLLHLATSLSEFEDVSEEVTIDVVDEEASLYPIKSTRKISSWLRLPEGPTLLELPGIDQMRKEK
ncbi:hypothetical protein BJ742DRAFT_780897 [Cladochytrium replicatum]|nr:hypothetical protein BJ742DRAFT_780897 [Cladochytrium replicatum]